MWRAFFYAVGYMTIFIGLQSLAFEHVQLAPGKDALQVVRGMLNEDGDQPGLRPAGTVNFAPTERVPAKSSGSAYGPSRFASNGVGGGSFSATPYRNPNVGLGVVSGQSAEVPRVDPISYQTELKPSPPIKTSQRSGRVIQSKDWMPWSLLATGVIVVLYTRSFAVGS